MMLDRVNGKVGQNSIKHSPNKNTSNKSVENKGLKKGAFPPRPKKKYSYLEDYERSIGTVPKDKQ